jgi:hypothetical protein
LQNRLPLARVIYASATGASDVNNLAYATRLGLWGKGTAFPDRTSFIARIREGGIAAMELVARELKAMGVYTARALSYAGVEYDILEHALTPRQIADFDAYADAWAIIRRNLEAALGASGVTDPLEGKTLNGQALSAARSRFESSKQRFFGQLLLSMKLPSLIPAIEDALATDHSVVIQLVSTAEALLDRRLADLSAEDRAEIQLDLSPREIVADYLDNAFPTRAMESYWDEDGNERSRPMVDEAGNPVHSQEALRIKAETLELLGALPPIVPALDAIISRFGTDAVAEITGRTRRLVTLPDGSQRLESRTANQSLADANAFMGGPSASSSSRMRAARAAPTTPASTPRTSSAGCTSCWSRAGALTAPSKALAAPTARIRRRRRCSAPSPPIAAASGGSSRPSPAASMRLAR